MSIPRNPLIFNFFGHDPYLPYLTTFVKPKLRYLGSDEGMTWPHKLCQTYMLAAPNTKEAHSKQKHENVP